MSVCAYINETQHADKMHSSTAGDLVRTIKMRNFIFKRELFII